MARVAIIEPRSSGHWLIDRAVELGHQAVVLTHGAGSRRVPAERLTGATHVEIVDTNDEALVLEAVRRLHAVEPLHAVLPGSEHYLPVAAEAARRLGVPGITPDAARTLRHKHRMRLALAAAHVDQPAFALAASADDITAAVAHVGLPCVVKPVDQSGSLNVRKATSVAEAHRAFEAIQSPASAYLDRAGLPVALVEEYIGGPEFSVEGFVEDGEVHVLAITEKVLGQEPSFVEIGHIVPAQLAAPVAADIERYVARVVAVLGIGLGPFHAEVRVGGRGPLLMEVAARLPGDRIPFLLALARDVDLCAIMLRSYLGERNGQLLPAANGSRAGIRYFVRPELSSYATVTVAKRIEADPRIKEMSVLVPPGRITPNPGSSSERLGYVVATGATYQETVAVLDDADAAVCFS